MRVWRICRESFAADPLSGRGGLVTSGRWHSKGRRVTYATGALSLAALEVLVHTDKSMLPADLVRLEIDVPDKLKLTRIDVKSLPRDWRMYPAPAELQRLGDDWLSTGPTAVLQVPSAVIPEEFNFLLNPAQTDAPKIRVVSKESFAFDSRLRP